MARFTAGGLTESDLAPPPSGGGDPGGQKITGTGGSGASSANHRDAATTAPMTRAWRATERGRGIPPRVREVCLVDSIRFSSNIRILPLRKTPDLCIGSPREAARHEAREIGGGLSVYHPYSVLPATHLPRRARLCKA